MTRYSIEFDNGVFVILDNSTGLRILDGVGNPLRFPSPDAAYSFSVSLEKKDAKD